MKNKIIADFPIYFYDRVDFYPIIIRDQDNGSQYVFCINENGEIQKYCTYGNIGNRITSARFDNGLLIASVDKNEGKEIVIIDKTGEIKFTINEAFTIAGGIHYPGILNNELNVLSKDLLLVENKIVSLSDISELMRLELREQEPIGNRFAGKFLFEKDIHIIIYGAWDALLYDMYLVDVKQKKVLKKNQCVMGNGRLVAVSEKEFAIFYPAMDLFKVTIYDCHLTIIYELSIDKTVYEWCISKEKHRIYLFFKEEKYFVILDFTNGKKECIDFQQYNSNWDLIGVAGESIYFQIGKKRVGCLHLPDLKFEKVSYEHPIKKCIILNDKVYIVTAEGAKRENGELISKGILNVYLIENEI